MAGQLHKLINGSAKNTIGRYVIFDSMYPEL